MSFKVDPNRRRTRAGDPCPALCAGHLVESLSSGWLECNVDNCRLRVAPSATKPTGVFIRASFKGKFGNYDLDELDRESAETWTRGLSDEGKIEAVLILLRHR